MYDTKKDALRYLKDSIIRYKKEPVVVVDCRGNGKAVSLYLQPLTGGRIEICNINNPDLDFEPVPLGYGMDNEGDIFYFKRIPSRMWKQGLHNNNLRTISIKTRDPFGKRNTLLRNCIKGVKVSFKEALEDGGVFHRFFRVDFPFLFYKEQLIGAVSKQGEFTLEEKYSYLENYVREVTVK